MLLRCSPAQIHSRFTISCLLGFSLFLLATDFFPSPGLLAQEKTEKEKVSQDSTEKPGFSDAQLEHFETKIRPLLAKRCFECHGPDAEEAEGGLRFSSRGSLLKGGDTGAAIVPGKPEDSLLIDTINYGEVYEMPPDSKLPQEEIDLLTDWVRNQAPWPKVNDAHLVESKSFDIAALKKEHWCWQPVRSITPPEVKNEAWPLDAIDRFILRKNEDAGLQMASDANRRTWIRRVYFDLIGLPPTPAEVEAFVNDDSDRAHEKVVDRLLGSQHFGERWARHWMDLIRYAETCGHEFEYPIPYAYRYRDYLIRAFNEDVPYDLFIKEHLAGDLLPDPRLHPSQNTNESILGTGFWFLHEATHAPVDVKLDEANHIDNRIDVMSKSFLGLTVACARCHDHKFDAISTQDYYALAGFLQSSRRQLAMLDPDGRIESGTQKIRQIRQSISQRLRTARAKGSEDLQSLKRRLLASSQNQSEVTNKTGAILEAEDLKVISNNAGERRVQQMASYGDQWSGDKQLFWIADKPDGLLKLTLPVAQTGKYKVRLSLTKAPDYGIFQVLIDGKKLGPAVDGYHGSVIKQDDVELGVVELNKGNHELAFQITGTNPKANPQRFMVGADLVQLAPVVDDDAQVKRPSESEAESAEIQRWTEELVKARTDVDHPLWLWQQVTRNGKSFDPAVLSNLKGSLGQQIQMIERGRPARKGILAEADSLPELPYVFTDFDKPNFGNWFVTGEAFGSQPTAAGHWNSNREEVATLPAGYADGSQYSKKLHGVLRSPTFEIQSNEIWYRIKGENVKLRVIIDGYVMDVYNGLLFRGVSVNVNTKGKFQWVRQAGDLHRYKGRRAHIEIIDQGGGYAVVDRVLFSDRGHPPHVPANAAKLLPEVIDAKDLEQFANRYAAALVKSNLVPVALTSTYPEIQKAVADARQMIATIERDIPNPILAPAMTDGTPENEFVFVRGNHKALGPIAERRLLEALVGPEPIQNPNQGSGRLEMANQIASSDNPLTSRVLVNRLWHHLFGRGIVASTDNFGVLGKEPSHPELLDYLASEFVREGWSIKKMIKRMVLTRTYRIASELNPEATDIDPDNKLLHRFRIRRMQGEAIRDAMLAISGRLDPKVSGPSVPLHLTPFMQGRGRPGRNGPVDGDGRRSLYTEIRRNFLPPMLIAFDMPIPFNSVGRRNVSNVPAQALILMNDPFVVGQAEIWAKKLIQQQPEIRPRIKQMYLEAYAREPSSMELDAALEFIRTQASALGISEQDAASNVAIWKDLCHVLFNVKEFIYVR